jgi:hypothetical protein
MKEPLTDIPLFIAKLMVAYFQGTISPSEHDQLDQWVESSKEHLTTFEEFVEIVFRNHQAPEARQ